MVSICIIVKNEAENLEICLQNLIKLEYEIIVVDTGSTDNTKQVAIQYTDKVYEFKWIDDFSAARNYAVSKASFDYIMMVDSDEFIVKFDKTKFEKLLFQHPKEVGRIYRNNMFVRDGLEFNSEENVNRIFSKKYYHYKGKIHEQIEAINKEDYRTYIVPFYFKHNGYDGSLEERKRKTQRNLKLLDETLKVEGEDPYILYQIGKSYYMQMDYKKSTEFFEKAINYNLNPNLEYVIDMVQMYGYSLVNSGQLQKALMLENVYNEFSDSADFVFMLGIVYMQNSLLDKALIEFINATSFSTCKVSGVNSYLSFYNIGVIYECIGEQNEALEYYLKCNNYELAKKGITRINSLK